MLTERKGREAEADVAKAVRRARYEAKAECMISIFLHSDGGPCGHDAAYLASSLLSLKCKEYGISKDHDDEQAVKLLCAGLQERHCLRGAIEATKEMFMLPDGEFSSLLSSLRKIPRDGGWQDEAERKARSFGIRWEP